MNKRFAIFVLVFSCACFSVLAGTINELLTRDPYRKIDDVSYDLTGRFQWDVVNLTNYEAIPPHQEWKEFRGNVIQITSDGILFSKEIADERETVFIKNFPKNIPLVDGEQLAVYAMPSGRYSYISTLGANKTIYAYDYGTIPSEDETKKLKAEAAERLKQAQEAAEKAKEEQQREIANRRAEVAKAKEAQRAAVQQKVLKHYQSQAGTGDGFAQFRLGEIYFHGECGETNFMLAQKWFGIAATNGYPEATNLLNKLNQMADKK
jgi:hypothetical protein